MEIGKRVILNIKNLIMPFFHDPRHLCNLERNAVIRQHLTSRHKYSANYMYVLNIYTCIKFHEVILNGFKVIERPQFCHKNRYLQSKKISNDQELIQSDPISCPQNQKGNN